MSLPKRQAGPGGLWDSCPAASLLALSPRMLGLVWRGSQTLWALLLRRGAGGRRGCWAQRQQLSQGSGLAAAGTRVSGPARCFGN